MKLIAKKPCSFDGKRFYIGDEIPVESVLDPKLQEQMGVLAIVQDEDPAPARIPLETMDVAVKVEEGEIPLCLTREGLQAVVDVLTGNVEDAVPIVEQMDDPDALMLLHMADKRKGVKDAAENRAKDLVQPESAGEQ